MRTPKHEEIEILNEKFKRSEELFEDGECSFDEFKKMIEWDVLALGSKLDEMNERVSCVRTVKIYKITCTNGKRLSRRSAKLEGAN